MRFEGGGGMTLRNSALLYFSQYDRAEAAALSTQATKQH